MSVLSTKPLILEGDLVRDCLIMPDSFEFGTFRMAIGKLPKKFSGKTLASDDDLAKQAEQATDDVVGANVFVSKTVVEGDYKPSRLYWVDINEKEIAEFNLPIIQLIYNSISGTAMVVVPAMKKEVDNTLPYRTTYWRLDSPEKETWHEVDYFEYVEFKLNNLRLTEDDTPDETLEQLIEREKAEHEKIYAEAIIATEAKKKKLGNRDKKKKKS